MDIPSLEQLLSDERVRADEIDDLVQWAHGRAQDILEASGDPDLVALLDEAPAIPDPVPPRQPDAGHPQPVEPDTSGPADLEAEFGEGWEPSVDAAPESSSEDVEQSAAEAAPPQREPSQAAPLPPIPSAARAAAQDDEDLEEIEEIELLDEDELELVEGDEDDEAASPEDAPTYGPPDGNENVPEWKAALYSAELGDDRAALRRMEEESGLKAIPQPVQTGNTEPSRLQPEDDEISQHSVDLSDLGEDA